MNFVGTSRKHIYTHFIYINRNLSETLYRIHVKQTGTASLSVDGTPVSGHVLPCGKDVYAVEVTV